MLPDTSIAVETKPEEKKPLHMDPSPPIVMYGGVVVTPAGKEARMTQWDITHVFISHLVVIVYNGRR
jgi:hypothetical protein